MMSRTTHPPAKGNPKKTRRAAGQSRCKNKKRKRY